jgi:hypothetical protein
MSIITSTRYPAIIIIYDISTNYILKIPKNGEEDNDIIDYEYSIYQLINHKSFNSFDTIYEIFNPFKTLFLKLPTIKIKLYKILENCKSNMFKNKLNILMGKYNSNMITFFDYRNKINEFEKITDTYNQILSIKEETFIKYGFVHGDFKTNNILIDKINPSNIQIIDFEFSIIFKDKKKINMRDAYFINLYLQMPDEFEITDEFGRLFDIYLLCAEIYNNYHKPIQLVEYIKNIFIEPKIKYMNISFIDFYIILINLEKIDKIDFFDKETKCINMRFESIYKNLSNIEIPSDSIEFIKDRVDYINNVFKNFKY